MNEILLDEPVKGVMEIDVLHSKQMVDAVESVLENIAKSSITNAIAEDAIENPKKREQDCIRYFF